MRENGPRAGRNLEHHIVSSFDQELALLKQTIVEMGGVAEEQLDAAVRCIVRRDVDLASKTVRADERLDELERAIDLKAVQLLALRQPMAQDLREIIGALKIASDLERIGDYAANIAKRSIALSQVPTVRPISGLPRMAQLAREIISDVLDAYNSSDLELAIAVWHRDEEIDDLYTAMFRETLTYMMEDPRNITPCTHLLFIAKNVERIGDHATNIAETLHFAVSGNPMEKSRPKGDASSFAVVEPLADLEDLQP